MLVDEDQIRRFVHAIALGHVCDVEFAEQCAERGISAAHLPGSVSPLEVVGRAMQAPEAVQ